MRRIWIVTAVASALAACSADPSADPGAAVESAAEAPIAARAGAAGDVFAGPNVSVDASEGVPAAATPGFYMAYMYGLGLELPGDKLASVMDAHTEACLEAGPLTCQLMSVSREGDPDVSISGSLRLRAQPDWLQGFLERAAESADAAGGEVRLRTTSAEDVTRQMVDTEARLAALRTLRDRLLEILQSRPGQLADLLEVERELARVQGDLDAATSALAVLRQRVTMSELQVSYVMADRAMTPRTFEPIGRAASGFLHTLSLGVAGIITIVATLLPWALFLAAAIWALRLFKIGRGWRWPWNGSDGSSRAKLTKEGP